MGQPAHGCFALPRRPPAQPPLAAPLVTQPHALAIEADPFHRAPGPVPEYKYRALERVRPEA
jgi:hypothetical protein